MHIVREFSKNRSKYRNLFNDKRLPGESPVKLMIDGHIPLSSRIIEQPNSTRSTKMPRIWKPSSKSVNLEKESLMTAQNLKDIKKIWVMPSQQSPRSFQPNSTFEEAHEIDRLKQIRAQRQNLYETEVRPEIYKLIKRRNSPKPLSMITFYQNQKLRKSYDYATNFISKNG